MVKPALDGPEAPSAMREAPTCPGVLLAQGPSIPDSSRETGTQGCGIQGGACQGKVGKLRPRAKAQCTRRHWETPPYSYVSAPS